MRTLIKNALQSDTELDLIYIQGWVRTRRDSKAFSFLEINDGTCLKNLQVIVDANCQDYAVVEELKTGASVSIAGKLVASQGKGQQWEVHATHLQMLGAADDAYPLQKKGHSPEFLRTIAHLRPRTNLYGAVFRIRSRLAFAIHTFFHERDFIYVHTPIITSSDCEGAGELFRVTTLDPDHPPQKKDGSVDFGQDFFARPTYLTVSGQLEGETFACALSNIYTFGPTFRAENSHTSRHASEFWMVEPEMAFCDLEGDMSLAEDLIQYLVKDILDHNEDDLELFAKFVDKQLLQRLQFVVERAFQRMTYSDAVKILQRSGKQFEYPVEYGMNLQSEHERFLTEEHCRCPVTAYNYPKTIKPFYMRTNDDGDTVAAMDLLVPGIGEIIGGSQREERLDVLDANMQSHGLPQDEYNWYRDLRRFGSVPHAGFGLGFERMLMFITGVRNIRDVIPFPRTPGVIGC